MGLSGEAEEIARFGPDRVFREGERLVVVSPADMSDWEVRRYRRIRILFEGKGYFLAAREEDGGAHLYRLDPWPEDYPDPPWTTRAYDRDYVRARQIQEEAIRQRQVSLVLLAPVVPLVGFLPRYLKAIFEERYGIHPRTATSFSLGVEWVLIVAHGGLLLIQMFVGALGGAILFSVPYLITALIVLTADAWVRKDSMLAEEANPPGFYEWLFRMKLW